MDSEVITQVQFDASGTNIEIHESLTQVESIYDDEVPSSANTNLLDEIKLYASEIQCSDFHGKGTVDDYTALFNAASKIANDVKQMQMDVDVDGFNEFGQAADELSSLFTSFIARLQNVSIIDDSVFLQSIATALRKIVNLSKVFGKFKETILATSTIKIPKSVQDAKVVLEGVMDEVHCAMNYISYFVSPTENVPVGAALDDVDKDIIDKAVATIDNWSVLCEHGVSIALSNDADIQYITQANTDLKSQTTMLQSATSALRAKLDALKNF